MDNSDYYYYCTPTWDSDTSNASTCDRYIIARGYNKRSEFDTDNKILKLRQQLKEIKQDYNDLYDDRMKLKKQHDDAKALIVAQDRLILEQRKALEKITKKFDSFFTRKKDDNINQRATYIEMDNELEIEKKEIGVLLKHVKETISQKEHKNITT